MVELLKTTKYPVKTPKFNVGSDAGIDFFVPAYSEGFLAAFQEKNPGKEIVKNKDDKYVIRVEPHGDVNIPSGIYSKFPSNIARIGANKSGIASKKKLVYGAHVIDASYQGIIHLHMINTSNEWQEIPLDEKIVQFIPTVIDVSGVTVTENIEPENWFTEKTIRGDGGFGSTGTV